MQPRRDAVPQLMPQWHGLDETMGGDGVHLPIDYVNDSEACQSCHAMPEKLKLMVRSGSVTNNVLDK